MSEASWGLSLILIVSCTTCHYINELQYILITINLPVLALTEVVERRVNRKYWSIFSKLLCYWGVVCGRQHIVVYACYLDVHLGILIIETSYYDHAY